MTTKPLFPNPVAEFDVLPVKEEIFIETPDLLQEAPSEKEKPPAEPIHISRNPVAVPRRIIQLGPLKKSREIPGKSPRTDKFPER